MRLSHSEVLTQVSSIFSSLDDTNQSGVDVSSQLDTLRERKAGIDRPYGVRDGIPTKLVSLGINIIHKRRVSNLCMKCFNRRRKFWPP